MAMRDMSISLWVERKRWLGEASWFTVWDAAPDLTQAVWEWPPRRRPSKAIALLGRFSQVPSVDLRETRRDLESVLR